MRSLLRRIAAVGLSVLLLWGPVNPATAATDPPSSPPPSGSSPTASTSYSLKPTDFSLMVSPTRLTVGPADIGTVQKILVVNRGQAPTAVTVQKRNFTAGADGSLVFQQDAPYAASDWVSVDPESFQIAPGDTQTVTATITEPAAPDAGDHQVAIVFLVPSGQTDGNIKINRGIGTPVYITVPGPTDDSVALGDLSASAFAINGPVTLTTTVRDTGTVHRDFRDPNPLTVDTAGDAAPFPDFTVIRGGTREVSTTWDPPLMCVCNPSVSIVNADGTVQSASVRVIVFPLKLLGILLGAVLVGWVIVLFSRRRSRAR